MGQSTPPSTRSGRKRQPPSTSGNAGQHLGSGLQFAVTIALCAYGGWWVDARWGTTPWFLIGGCLFGSVAAFYHLYRSLVGPPADTDDSTMEETK